MNETDATRPSGLDALLAEAARVHRLHDDGPFRALLLEMIALAPRRSDLRLNLGNHYIQCGMVDDAISVFAGLARDYPGDPDVLTFLAHWLRFSGKTEEPETLLARMAAVRPERASDLAKIWAVIDARLSLSPTDALPASLRDDDGLAILTLGLVLNPDGSMRQGLIDRLQKTLDAATAYKKSRIVVTGGVPRSGKIEAREMRRWLCARGVAPERIHEEGYARDVVENITYSRQIMDALGVRTVLAVTSANNVRRAGAALEIVGWISGSPWKAPAAVAASGGTFAEFVDDGGDRLKLYRDSLRAYGLPMMRTYPDLAEI